MILLNPIRHLKKEKRYAHLGKGNDSGGSEYIRHKTSWTNAPSLSRCAVFLLLLVTSVYLSLSLCRSLASVNCLLFFCNPLTPAPFTEDESQPRWPLLPLSHSLQPSRLSTPLPELRPCLGDQTNPKRACGSYTLAGLSMFWTPPIGVHLFP